MADITNAGGISLQILSTKDILRQADEASAIGISDTGIEINYDGLVSHITTVFENNRRAKEESGIEDDIIDSQKAFNGEYSAEDIERIKRAKGSEIFMNLTATKSRAAKSWIADILKPSQGDPWSIEPTPVEDLPEDIRSILTKSLEKEFATLVAAQQQAKPQGQTGGASPTEAAQETIREINQRKRDIQNAVQEEIFREAKFQLQRMERRIKDQLVEGDWDQALSDFLDDFVVYPTAFLKGPVVQNRKKLMWKNGAVEEVLGYKFSNIRVSPFDIYPSPSAKGINDGNLCEHMRFDLAQVEAMKGVEGFHDDMLDEVIEDYEMGIRGSWYDFSVEQDKNDLEQRGRFSETMMDEIHAIHFWGNTRVKNIRDWKLDNKIEELDKQDDNDIVQIEAILIGNRVVKCVINDDPLQRRPYFKASFMNIPGSFWGKSLPKLMESVQRMCNAVARALANNLGIASGPQIEIYVDRLADNGAIDDITPFKIWQLRSDPTGSGGRAIQFWQPQSNAESLLKVYNVFEEKADDITGIPKYAYGNERTGGAAQTAQGLALLLESTSKIIKDCIRNIDEGLIKPRIMYQFHYNMLNMGRDFNYTGDINVVTVGSGTLTIKGAEATKRNEFLMATSNPIDIEVMDVTGRAAILRRMADDLGLPNVIPTDFELKQQMKKKQIAQQELAMAEQRAEEAKANRGVQSTQIQIEGQERMHQVSMQERLQELQAKMQQHDDKIQVEILKLQRQAKKDANDAAGKFVEEDGRNARQTQEVALKLKQGEGI
jgi:hypothetical protein